MLYLPVAGQHNSIPSDTKKTSNGLFPIIQQTLSIPMSTGCTTSYKIHWFQTCKILIYLSIDILYKTHTAILFHLIYENDRQKLPRPVSNHPRLQRTIWLSLSVWSIIHHSTADGNRLTSPLFFGSREINKTDLCTHSVANNFQAVFLYCCPDCPSCSVNEVQFKLLIQNSKTKHSHQLSCTEEILSHQIKIVFTAISIVDVKKVTVLNIETILVLYFVCVSTDLTNEGCRMSYWYYWNNIKLHGSAMALKYWATNRLGRHLW